MIWWSVGASVSPQPTIRPRRRVRGRQSVDGRLRNASESTSPPGGLPRLSSGGEIVPADRTPGPSP